jgi:hypothetical protein
VKSNSGRSDSESDSASDERILIVLDRFAERSSTSCVPPVLLTMFTDKVVDMIRIQKVDRRSRFPVTNLFCYIDKMDVGDGRRDAARHATQSIEKATHTRMACYYGCRSQAIEVSGRFCSCLIGDYVTIA